MAPSFRERGLSRRLHGEGGGIDPPEDSALGETGRSLWGTPPLPPSPSRPSNPGVGVGSGHCCPPVLVHQPAMDGGESRDPSLCWSMRQRSASLVLPPSEPVHPFGDGCGSIKEGSNW